MRKTIYFTSEIRQAGQLTEAIKTATEKRDEFLSDNIDQIGQIDFEDIKITPLSGNRPNVVVTIMLAYYPK